MTPPSPATPGGDSATEAGAVPAVSQGRPTPAIRVSGLRFAYAGSDRTGVSFELALDQWTVERGARVALHGPSGCGKSTLLDLLAGVLRPSAGSIEVEGRDLARLTDHELRAHRIRTLGFVFQDFPLVDYLDALENVLFPYRLNPALRLDEVARERARELLVGLGLEGKERRLPRQLSVGERQRVAIARALVTGPALLLADEPTAGLDPTQALAVMQQLEAASSGHGLTLVMVTHDPALLGRFDHTLAVDSVTRSGAGAGGAA